MDGSGGHAIYQQLSNAETRNMIMFMFCILNIKDENGKVLFKEMSATSPFSMRPVFLVLGKEEKQNLEDVKTALAERENIQEFQVLSSKGTHEVKLDASFAMIDAKMRGLCTGLGGAFCLLCTASSNAACGRVKNLEVEDICTINRTMEETQECYERLKDDDGKVLGSSIERQGLTTAPLLEDDTVFSVSPLHCIMRTFDFVKLLLYHLKSETFHWSSSSLQLGKRPFQRFEKAQDKVRKTVKAKTGLPLDQADPTGQGGNANKGDLCKKLLVDHRELMVSLVPHRFQADLRELMCRLWVILFVYNSKRKVKTDVFKDFCITTYKSIFNGFNNKDRWINVSPTVHSLLAHSPELIENNDCCGLGNFSESGLENNNKYLRFYRRNLARKNM